MQTEPAGGWGLFLIKPIPNSAELGETEDVIPKFNYRHLCFKPFILSVGLVWGVFVGGCFLFCFPERVD